MCYIHFIIILSSYNYRYICSFITYIQRSLYYAA